MKLTKTQWLLALAFATVSLTACQHQAGKPAAADAINNAVIHKSPNDDRSYAALLLPNQLQVVLVSDPSLEKSAASLAVHVGSAQDPESQPGLAHYLEHMLFLGTKKYPIPDNFMEFVATHAGSANASTGFELTNYHFTVEAGAFAEALDRYSDYFKAPLLDPHYAEKERNAVNAEWSKNRDQDGWIFQEIKGLTANPANPASRFSIGNLETLSDKKNSKLQGELEHFYKRYYSANNMRLTLVGKQSIPELKVLAEKYFAEIHNSNIEIPRVTVPGLTEAQMGKVIGYRPQQELKKLLLQLPIKNNKSEWRLKPNQILSSILGSEDEGTLCEQLRRVGLIDRLNVSIVPDAYGADGYIQFDATLTDMGFKDRDKVAAAIFSYIELVKKQGVDESYFRELQTIKAKDFLNVNKPNPLQQAIGLSASQFDLPVENLMDAGSVYERFEPQAINNLLLQLQPAKARIWYIGPNEAADKSVPYSSGKYSIRDITPEEHLRWEQLSSAFSFNLPAKNTLFSDKPARVVDSIYLKPHSVVSEKGIEIFLTHPEFYREDKGVLDIELNVNFAQQTAKNVVLSYLLNDIYETQNRALIDRAGRASLRVNAAVGATGSQFINIAGYTEKHPELLQKMFSGFAGLTISENEFNHSRSSYREALLNNKKRQVYSQANEHAQRLKSNVQWTDAELIAALDKTSLKEIVAYHKLVKANLLIRIYAFGNYSEDTIKHFAQIARAQLPGVRKPNERRIPQFITPAIGKNIAFTEKVDLPDSAIVDLYMDSKQSDDEVAQVGVLNALYRSEFFKQLRTDEQIGYVVNSFPAGVNDYAGFAMLVQSANTDAAAIKVRMDRFRSEFFTQLQAVDPAKIEQIKSASAASILQKPTNFYSEAKRYDGDFWYGRFNFDSRERHLAALAKVDKAGLMEFYQRILLDKKSVNILVQLQGTHGQDKPAAAVKP